MSLVLKMDGVASNPWDATLKAEKEQEMGSSLELQREDNPVTPWCCPGETNFRLRAFRTISK